MKIYKLLPLLMLALVSSCADDAFVEIVDPVQTGEEIRFTPVLPKESSTRTIYGDNMEIAADGSRYYPVYWVNEKDSILIFCPQASAPVSRSVEYKVQAGKHQNVASAVVKVGEVGLQWGAQDEHKFYAIYPSSTALDNQTSQGTVMTNIANVQRPIKTKFIKKDNRYIVYPDMTHAVMSAYGSFKKSELTQNSTVDLHFTPQMTALEVVVKGPASGQPIQLTSIVVSDANHQPICGDYVFKMDELGNMTWKSASEGVVNSQIIIPCENIKLEANQEAVFKVFMSPDADEVGKIVPKVTVNTLNGSKTKTLNHTTLAPHKIARAILPNLVAGTNYWMSNLDPNIYVTELSYPGSKMSMLTRANRAGVIYQNSTITEQFEAGVRAFIIQTSVLNGKVYVSTDVEETGTTLKTAIKEIADCISALPAEAKQEHAFVMVTFRNGEVGNESDAQRNWMKQLRRVITEMSADPSYRLFTSEVTPNTTLGEVKDCIILKANYNSDSMNQFSGYENASDVPLLLSLWEKAYPHNDPGFEDGSPLYWGKLYEDKGFIIPNIQKKAAKLKWFYQEVTTVKNEGSDAKAEALYSAKEEYMKTVFTKSINLYKTGNHDTWFMNDLGGRFTDITSDSQGVYELSDTLQSVAVKTLQKRVDNAALGLVFMNYADRFETSGKLVKSDWLIQTIIDNNFKFQLRKKDTGTASYAPTRVDAEGASDDEWDK